jgi:protein TonB
MNTTHYQVFKDYFAPTMKLVVNNHASEYVPVHNMVLSTPASYQVVSAPQNKRALITLIVLLHLLAFIGIAKNYQQNSYASGDITPMLVSLINAPKPKVNEAPAIAKEQPKVEKKIAVATQEKSTLLANEKPEIKQSQTEPISEKTQIANAATAESSKKSEQKSEPEITFEPPRFNADYLHNPAPEYPGMSRRRGEQGRLTLKVVVNTNGDAESVQLDKSSGFELLDKAALNAVKNWKFIPAKSNHQPVAGTVIVPVRFSLDS